MADIFNVGRRRTRMIGPATEGNYNPGIDQRKPNGFKLMVPWGSGNNQLRTMTGIEGMNTPEVEQTESQEGSFSMDNLLDLNQGGLVGQRGPLGEYGLSPSPRSETIYQNQIYPFNPDYSPFNSSGYFYQAISDLQNTIGDILTTIINIFINRGSDEVILEPGCGIIIGGGDNQFIIGVVYGDGLECLTGTLQVKLDGDTLAVSGSGLKGNYDGDGATNPIKITNNTISLEYDTNMFSVVNGVLKINLDTC